MGDFWEKMLVGRKSKLGEFDRLCHEFLFVDGEHDGVI